MNYFWQLSAFEQSIRPQPDPLIEEFVAEISELINRYAARSLKMGLEETISERLQAGFLSDSREGRVQAYFAWYNANKDYEHFDGQEAQRREMEAGVTQADWNAYHRSFEAQF